MNEHTTVPDDEARPVTEGKGDNGGGDKKPHPVRVTLNGKPKEIRPGDYTTETLKDALNVKPELDLDIQENDALRTLKPNEPIVVVEGMAFVSHRRQGGSS